MPPLQEEGWVALSGQKLPAGQANGSCEPSMQNHPPKQSMGLAEPFGQNAPALHRVGLAAPAGQEDPAGHSSGRPSPPVQNQPAGHIIVCVDAGRSGQNSPAFAGHGVSALAATPRNKNATTVTLATVNVLIAA